MGKTGDSDIKHKNRREYIIIMVVMFKVDIGFIQYLSKAKDLQKLKPFNLIYRYIDDVLSIGNPNFASWIPGTYPNDLR
jgi:hypothetical protein